MAIRDLHAVVILYLTLTLADFRVKADVTFEDTATNVSVVVGNTAVLPCIVNGLGTKTVVWVNMKTSMPYSVGRTIFTSDERFTLASSSSENDWTVLLTDVRPTDQGVFRCMASTITKLYRDIDLSVLTPPKIRGSANETDTVNEGATVELACNGEGIPQPTVTWYEGDRVINTNNGGTSETLLIPNITVPLDGKVYWEFRCVLDNGAPPVAIKHFKVNILSVPNLQLISRSNTAVSPGSDAILSLRCTANPPPFVIWSFNGNQLNEFDRRYKIDSQGRSIYSLTITGVTEEDFGFYTVECTNIYNTASTVFQVKKLTAPDIDLTRSSGNQTVYLGDSLNISCYSSSEDARFAWFSAGLKVASGNTLSIPSVKASDAGLYICMTGNVIGYTTHRITITVQDISTPPPTAQTSNVTATTQTNPLTRSDIDCGGSSISLHVPLDLLPSGQQVTWNDPACVVSNNGTHLTGDIDLGECGTYVVFNTTHVIFENELVSHASTTNNTSGAHSVIDYGNGPDSVIVVQCVYPRREQESLGFRPIQGQVRFYEKTLGHMQIHMREARDVLFDDMYPSQTEPRVVHLNDPIYIKLDTEQGNTTKVAINVDRCLATPSPSPLDTDFQELTDNGCPALPSVTIHSSPVSEVHLSFQAFKFTNHPSAPVYVHCEVYVCPLSDPHCVTGCMDSVARTRRAATGGIKTHLVSTGPFPVADDKDQGAFGGESTALVAVTGLCAVLAVAATVFGVMAWRGRRRLPLKETLVQ